VERAAHSALREEAGKLRGRLVELAGVEEKLGVLTQQHEAAEAKMEQLEQEKLVSVKAFLYTSRAILQGLVGYGRVCRQFPAKQKFAVAFLGLAGWWC
jgi:hypothetical protein